MAPLIERAALGWANLGGYACAEPPTRASQLSVFERARHLGVRMHDTAIDYGRGFAEEGLGAAWTQSGIARAEIRIQSKVLRRIVAEPHEVAYREADLWRCPDPHARWTTTWDWSRAGILEQAKQSRERLQIDFHDGLALHDPAEACRQAGLRITDFAEAVDALRDLKEQGLLREIGIGSKEIGIAVELLRSYPGVFGYVMIMNYNLLDHHQCIETLIPLCRERGIRLFQAGPYASGILASSIDHLNSSFYYQPASAELLQKFERLMALAREYGMTNLKAAAVQFVTANDAFSRIVFGGRDAAEFYENITNLTLPIPSEFWSNLRELEINGETIIHRDAPLPG